MNETELQNLLNQAAAEVQRRIGTGRTTDGPQMQAPFAAAAPPKTGTVVLVPSLVPFQEEAVKELTDAYGTDLLFVTFDGQFQADRQRVIAAEKESRSRILGMIEDCSRVVLLAPPMSVMRRIAEAEDEDFLTYLFLRAHLWGKQVCIYLDFELPFFRRSKTQESISERLEALKGLGFPLVYYREAGPAEGDSSRMLITEQDVTDAYNSGRKQISCGADAIITPLARDRAGELGVEFNTGEVF